MGLGLIRMGGFGWTNEFGLILPPLMVTSTPLRHPPPKWQPPGKLQYKINFDGALFQAENCAGIGVVIRNECGQVMVSLSQNIPPAIYYC